MPKCYKGGDTHCCSLVSGHVTIGNIAAPGSFFLWNRLVNTSYKFTSEDMKRIISWEKLRTVIQCPVYIESAVLLLLACLGAIGHLYDIYIYIF